VFRNAPPDAVGNRADQSAVLLDELAVREASLGVFVGTLRSGDSVRGDRWLVHVGPPGIV
jgi:hypothetical protein